MNYPGKRADAHGRENIKSSIKSNLKPILKASLIIVILLASVAVKVVGVESDRLIVKSDAAKTESTEETIESRSEEKNIPIYIDISGQVQSPGVYEVSHKTRLFEVIEKAGGLTKSADIDMINQAAFVNDGDKIVIPAKGGAEQNNSSTASNTANNASTNTNAVVNTGTVNINTADKEALKTLPGIGDALADRIIEYRSKSPFSKSYELKNVKGIGDAIYENLKEKISV